MDPDDLAESAADEVEDDAPAAPPGGALRAIGELLAALLMVAAVLAALLIGAVGVQWIFR